VMSPYARHLTPLLTGRRARTPAGVPIGGASVDPAGRSAATLRDRRWIRARRAPPRGASDAVRSRCSPPWAEATRSDAVSPSGCSRSPVWSLASGMRGQPRSGASAVAEPRVAFSRCVRVWLAVTGGRCCGARAGPAICGGARVRWEDSVVRLDPCWRWSAPWLTLRAS
jgi:hypothetical protein